MGSLPHTTLQTSQCLPVNMMMKGFLVLLCFHLGYSLEISLGRDSNVYPLFLNPFDVTHWKCLGYTVYENTFMAALAAKIGFPWIYEYITGNNFFQAVGLVSRSGVDYEENYLDYSSEESFSDKSNALVTEMEKAVYRDPKPYSENTDSYSGFNKYNRYTKQF